jgi:hypothetical protein
MPFYLPLAADWGDLIFLIVVLVGGLVQWISGLRKKPDPGEAEPQDFPPFGETGPGVPDRPRPYQDPADYDPEPSWDELMDALGKKTTDAPPPIPAPAPAPPAYAPPPPVPAPRLDRAEPASLSTPFRTLQDQSAQPESPGLSDHLKNLLATMDQPRPADPQGQAHGPSGSPLLEPRKTGDVPTVTGRTNTRFGRLLHEPGQVRRAIVLQEILQPPLALR